MYVHDFVAGVVVIDDQPEVSIDDPKYLFDSNEGFQEVLTKKQAKSKQRSAQEASAAAAAAAEAVKKFSGVLSGDLQRAVQQQAKLVSSKDALARSPKKVQRIFYSFCAARKASQKLFLFNHSVFQGSKAKKVISVSTSEQKRLNKLPPRLARAKAEALKQHGKPMSNGGGGKSSKSDRGGAGDAERNDKDFTSTDASNATTADKTSTQMMKIENWDNDMAKNMAQQSGTSEGGYKVLNCV